MPTRDVAPLGAPCWIDLMTSGKAATVAFYCDLLGWEAQDGGPDYGGYVTFLRDGHPVAGCMQHGGGEEPTNFWTVYLASADAAATAQAATEHGGGVFLPATPVMDLGTMAVVADPGGAGVGVWQPAAHAGFTLLGETGAPGWFELHTREYDTTVAFYRDVFGWDTHVESDVPEFRYTTLGSDGDQLAGIMDASGFPADAPLGWSVYFSVADTDAALARTVELGGSVVLPAEDSPYGRLAQAADATGSLFKLVAPI
jgi:predicted enzyme related to lactoylglutathione lyase